MNFINSYLDDDQNNNNPITLFCNKNNSFQGSTVLGKGFILSYDEGISILNSDIKYRDVVFPYLIGDDINNSPNQSPQRFVINFFDWTEEKAKNYPLAYNIILEKVMPERQKVNREARKKYWWRFGDRAVNLYNTISNNKTVFVVCRVTKYLCFSRVSSKYVYDVGTNTLKYEKFDDYSILQSTIHDSWARKYGSSLESRLRYLNEDCFETFPFPSNNSIQNRLEIIGESYHEFRKQLMISIELGLTKTYNLFHSNAITSLAINEKEKQVAGLVKHLEKTPSIISFNEAVKGILKLRELHKEMDESVLEAYGWHQDDPKWGEAIQLRHDFYEVDYLPENDRVRYTIHPEARKEVLKRLLQLNHERYAEEVAAGLHDKKGAKKEEKTKKVKGSKSEDGPGLFD